MNNTTCKLALPSVDCSNIIGRSGWQEWMMMVTVLSYCVLVHASESYPMPRSEGSRYQKIRHICASKICHQRIILMLLPCIVSLTINCGRSTIFAFQNGQGTAWSREQCVNEFSAVAYKFRRIQQRWIIGNQWWRWLSTTKTPSASQMSSRKQRVQHRGNVQPACVITYFEKNPLTCQHQCCMRFHVLDWVCRNKHELRWWYVFYGT